MNKPVSPIRWMVTCEEKKYLAGDNHKTTIMVVLKDGFEKITLAKKYKDELKEEGLKIMSYYE
jgi:hypothetical protein